MSVTSSTPPAITFVKPPVKPAPNILIYGGA